MKIQTTRFGEMVIPPEKIIQAPDGLLGFPDCTRWTLIDEERAAPFRMLQSLDIASLAFVLVDPLMAYPDYLFDITVDDLKKLCGPNRIKVNTDSLEIYCIVDLKKTNVRDTTLNLQGPLVYDPISRRLHQFILADTEYKTRTPLLRENDQKV